MGSDLIDGILKPITLWIAIILLVHVFFVNKDALEDNLLQFLIWKETQNG